MLELVEALAFYNIKFYRNRSFCRHDEISISPDVSKILKRSGFLNMILLK